MRVNSINNNCYNQKHKKQRVSFSAVHPTRYFLKTENGNTVEVTSFDLIKKLNRVIVNLLNRDFNDARKLEKGMKVANPKNRKLIDQIAGLFRSKDKDYNEFNKVASYIPSYKYSKDIKTYLFTGVSIDIPEDQARSIRSLNGDMKFYKDFYSFGNPENYSYAKKMVLEHNENRIQDVKDAYHKNMTDYLRDNITEDPKINSPFYAYFEINQKGKSTTYNLINAIIE